MQERVLAGEQQQADLQARCNFQNFKYELLIDMVSNQLYFQSSTIGVLTCKCTGICFFSWLALTDLCILCNSIY